MVASSGDRDDGAAARCPARDRAGVTPPAKPSRFPFGFPTMLQVRQRGRAWAKPLGRFGPASGVGANFNFAGSSAAGPQRAVSGHRARRAKPAMPDRPAVPFRPPATRRRRRSNPGPARSARHNLDRRIAEHRALGGNRVPDRNRCSNWPLACIDTLQSGNYLQAKLIVLAAALPPQNAEFLSLLQLHYSSKVAN